MLDCEYNADVFICDEADEQIEKRAVVFSQAKNKSTSSLYGLASVFFSKKAYFTSAQFDPYHIQLLKDAFSIKQETVEFDNFATLLSGIPTEDFEKDGSMSLDLDELIEQLCEKVTSTFDQHPHIVFMAKDNENLRNRL